MCISLIVMSFILFTDAMATQKAPLVKNRRNTFGFEPTYERRWDSVVELQAIQHKTPHR